MPALAAGHAVCSVHDGLAERRRREPRAALSTTGWEAMSDAILVRRTLLVSAIVVLVAALCGLVVLHPEVPLFVFGGILGAVALDALARPWLRLGASRLVAVPAALAALAALLVGAALWIGPQLAEQGRELVGQLPELFASARAELGRIGLGHDSIASALQPKPGESAAIEWQRVAPLAFGSLAGVFATAAGVVTGGAATAILAIFLALQPALYRDGALRLVPRERRPRIRDLFDSIDVALRGWIVGRLAAMALVAVVTALGLWLLDVRLALSLGLIAGVLTFVPYLGPILGAAPALVVALATSVETALWVALLYAGVQALENNVLTPVIQGKTISLPAALLIVSQLGMGALLGMLGLLLAAPLLVAAMVTVQVLYVRDVLEEPVRVLGAPEESAGRRGRARSGRAKEEPT
jgi:predicted PurR-regulated permease PerM